jgi:hypothetical protein
MARAGECNRLQSNAVDESDGGEVATAPSPSIDAGTAAPQRAGGQKWEGKGGRESG